MKNFLQSSSPIPIIVILVVLVFSYGFLFQRYSFIVADSAVVFRCSNITGECHRVKLSYY